MHRIFQLSILVAALYVSAGCSATRAPESPAQASIPPAAATPLPAEIPALPAVPAPPGASTNAVRHIALLLPLKSSNAYLQRAADAIQQGFMAAANVQPHGLPIRIYSCDDEGKEAVSLYQQALTEGALAVVGPATRAGAFALASQSKIQVPTLILNNAEGVAPSDKLYFFGLTLESEARQVAHLAMAADLHGASIVSSDSPLAKRVAQAFGEEWKKLGGEVGDTKIFTGNVTAVADLPVEPGNMVFVAAAADKARLFRPYLNAILPVYATSQVFNGNNNQMVNFDLRDVHFVDMPWLLQPDRPAIKIYPRANPPLETDMDRFYALGIDSYRLLQLILYHRLASLPLDGVTGVVRLNASHQFEREAVAAEFKQGLGLTPEGIAALNAAKPGANASRPADKEH